MVIGLFVQFFEDEFSPAMLQYVLPISDAAREAGYDILMVTEADGPHAVHRISSSGMVDGVILLNVAHEDPRLPVMRKMRQPGSMVGLPRNPEGFDVFDLDFAESGRILVDHLAERGHHELILITPREDVYERGGAYAWRFRDAALQQAATHGIRVRSYFGQTQQPAINQQLNQILDAQPGTAMIVHNDAVIAALPSVLYSRGLRVPDDLSVVGMFSEDFGRAVLAAVHGGRDVAEQAWPPGGPGPGATYDQPGGRHRAPGGTRRTPHHGPGKHPLTEHRGRFRKLAALSNRFDNST